MTAPLPEQVRVALANGISLDIIDTGPPVAHPNAPVLIFLHGFPESHRTWRHQIPHFADRFRCIAPDQRGYRGSSKPQAVVEYTPDKLIGDVFALADALGIDGFTVVGHDWGGAIAWGVAITGQMTGRVERAVIANAPHPIVFTKLLYTNAQQREASQYIRAFRDPANDALVREHGLTGLLQKVVRWNRSDAMETAERDALLRDWQDTEAAFGMLNYYRASPLVVPTMDEPFTLPDGWTPPSLPNLPIPTLVIWAMDDLALPAANLDGLDALVDDLTIARVEGCGHFVPWEAPDRFNAAMDAFLTPALAEKR